MAGGMGLMLAAMAKAIMTGTTMLAAAVLEVASLTRMAMKIAAKVMPQTELAPLKASKPFADGFGQLGFKHQIPQGDAAAEQEQGAPVDLGRLPPGYGEFPSFQLMGSMKRIAARDRARRRIPA